MKRNRAILSGLVIGTIAICAVAQEGTVVLPAGAVPQETGKATPGGPAEVAVTPAKPKKIVPKPVPVRFEATVYQLEIPIDQMSSLDAKVLATKAATAGAFETALKTLGSTRALYRVDQAIDLRSRAALSISSSVPIVTATSSVGEKKTSTISREKLGAKFHVVSSLDPDEGTAGAIPLSIELEISAVGNSGVDLGGASAYMARAVTQTNGGSATLGKPMVLITADGAGSPDDKSATATAFVTLIQLSATGE